jgi:hypothetical protein
MKKTILFLLLPVFLFASHTHITSLPYTCSSSDSFIVDDNYSTSGTGITIAASNVILNGNNKTITYGTGGSGYGITISGARTSVEIYNLTVSQGATGASSGFYNNINAITGINIHNCTFNVDYSAVGIIRIVNFTSNITGINISDNTINGNPVDVGAGNCIDIQGSGSPQFTGAIEGNTIYVSGQYNTSRPSGIFFSSVNGNNALNVYGNNVTCDGPDDNNNIRLWDSNNINIYSNTLTMNCDHCRGLNIDGGSDGNDVYSNNVDANTTAAIGSNSVIRVRYGSDNNRFYSNTINTEGATSCYPVRYGEVQASPPDDTPDRNKYWLNSFTGPSPLIYCENASDSSGFWNNTYIVTDGGLAIYFMSTGVAQQIDSCYFDNEDITTSGTYVIGFSTFYGTSQYSNIRFCNVDKSGVDITSGNINSGGVSYTLTTSGCRAEETTSSISNLRSGGSGKLKGGGSGRIR